MKYGLRDPNDMTELENQKKLQDPYDILTSIEERIRQAKREPSNAKKTWWWLCQHDRKKRVDTTRNRVFVRINE